LFDQIEIRPAEGADPARLPAFSHRIAEFEAWAEGRIGAADGVFLTVKMRRKTWPA